MLAETQLKEGHVLLLDLALITQFVVEEATEEFDISLLRVDGESLGVLGALSIVMADSFSVRLEHAKED